MTEIRNILLIGRTGNGKSTVANVISDSDKFKEGKFAISETKNVQIEEVEIDGINYRIVDTVGIGDTQLTMQKVLNKLANISYSLKDGLNQVFFVTSGRFTEEEITAYNLLRTVIFNNEIGNYTTIVRIHFPDFEDADTCNKDIQKTIENNGSLEKVIRSCKKVIHIDNPPVNLKSSKRSEQNKEIRIMSRAILLTNLQMCKDVYKPENLDELNERIRNYMDKKQILEKKIEDTEKKGEYMDEKQILEKKIKDTDKKGEYMDEKQILEKKIEDTEKKGEIDFKMLKKYEEQIKELERRVNLATAQQIKEKNPGFFEKVGTWIGQGPILLGKGLDKGVEKVD